MKPIFSYKKVVSKSRKTRYAFSQGLSNGAKEKESDIIINFKKLKRSNLE